MNPLLSPQSQSTRGISCLLPVYSNDDPGHLRQALKSIRFQSRPPDQLVVVEDGPLPEGLRNALDTGADALPMLRVRLQSKVGLGPALANGLHSCKFDLVARMDADDLARPERFERQEVFMRANSDVVLLGTAVEEFRVCPGDLGRLRRPVENDAEIRNRARTRNPFNHMSVMFRKSAVEAVGGYRQCPNFEDYDLWLRLLRRPGRVQNLMEVLMDVRIGNGLITRRRGLRYLHAEMNFLLRCRRHGLISTLDLTRSALVRVPARLAPTAVLDRFYNLCLRENVRD